MNIKKILPSKKFIKVLSGIVLIILIIILVGIVKNRKTSFRKDSQGKVLVVSDAIEKDTDGDGLKDWEESLWGTSITNPDSDGDGITDGDEVRKVQEFLADNDSNPDSLKNDTTKTGSLTRDILTIASAINQSGTLTNESKEVITNEIAKYLSTKNTNSTIPISQLEIIENATEVQIEVYATLMNQSFKKMVLTENEILLLKQYNEEMEKQEVTSYVEAGARFIKEAEKMKKVKVPQIYSREHVNYINSIHNMGTLFEDLSFHEEDPARAMSALVSIEQIFASYQAAILDYKDIVYN